MLNRIARGDENIIAVDRPGSGKTSALIIAAVDQCNLNSEICCIICATFDSSYQMYMRIQKMCKECKIEAKIGFINGFFDVHSDQDNVGFNILVGTCRESIDFINKKGLSESIKKIYLDDGDSYLAYTYVGPWLDQLKATQKVYVSAFINEKLTEKLNAHFKGDRSNFIANNSHSIAHLNYMSHTFIRTTSSTRQTMIKEICKKSVNKKIIIFCKVCIYIDISYILQYNNI